MIFLRQCIRCIHSSTALHRITIKDVSVFCKRVRVAATGTTTDDTSELYATVEHFVKQSSRCKTLSLKSSKFIVFFLSALSSLRILRQQQGRNTDALDSMVKLTVADLQHMKGLNELSMPIHCNLTHKLAVTWNLHRNTEIMKLQADIAIAKIDEFSVQGLSNTVWSFAKTKVPAEELFRVIGLKSEQRIHEFESQAISNTAWAFATAGIYSKPLFCCITTESIRRIHEFNPQALSITAWAFATSGFFFKDLFYNIATVSRSRIHEFNAQAISNTSWALATAGFSAEFFFNSVASACENNVNSFSPQHLTNIVWACATVGYYSENLFHYIASELERRIDELNPQCMSKVAWAFAMNDTRIESLFDALACASRSCIDDFSGSELSIFAWSCSLTTESISDRVSEIIAPALSTLCKKVIAGSISNVESRRQIMSSLFVLASLSGDKYTYLNDLFHSFCSSEFCPSPVHISSKMHLGVSDTLMFMGIKHDCEVPVCNNLFIVDIYLRKYLNGQPVVIEIDGPRHFFTNYTSAVNGKTAFKRKMLEKYGFHVVSIPYWNWPKAKKIQRKYLRTLLSINIPNI